MSSGINSGKRPDLAQGPARTDIAQELLELGFADADALPALREAVAQTRLVSYAPHETLYQEGDPVDALYIIRSGLIKLMAHFASGRARIVRLHNRASIIGLSGLIDRPYEHTAVAVRQTQAYQIPMATIQGLKREQPEVCTVMMEKWHGYLADADTWITEFSTGPIRGRTARLVRFLCDIDEQPGRHGVLLLTSEEIGEILGVTPESVSRVIADFKRQGILQASADDAGNAYLCDIARLEEEAQQ